MGDLSLIVLTTGTKDGAAKALDLAKQESSPSRGTESPQAARRTSGQF